MKVGIVGLPNAGKSTLFNALVTKAKAQTGKHPFTTINKNMGVVPVSDNILVELAKMATIKKMTQATITFVDIAGLVKDAHQGEGLGNQFLGHIREVDLILHVVRYFNDETVPHIHTEIDPKEDVEIVNTELMLADAASLETQLKKLRKKAISKEQDTHIKLAERVMEALNSGQFVSDLPLSDEEKHTVRDFYLLTGKPQVYVVNVDETNLKSTRKKIGHYPTITLSAKFEEELSGMKWTEARQFMNEYGLVHSALKQVITACYKALDLITFYTIVGDKEARAWAVVRSINAVEAAEIVHTDFAKKFIKAEIVSADDLLKIGSWKKAHDRGKIQLVGKDYPLQDHDVVEFKVGA